jgi:bifunctional non-homologous end joining protein LigD
MQPELLTETTPEEAAKLIIGSRFGLQEKRDGVRLLVRRQGNKFEGWNKKGQPSAVNPALTRALSSLNVDEFVLDGEFESPHFYCWDLLSAQNTDLSGYPYGERYKILQVFRCCPTVTILPCWTDEGDKERMVYEFRAQRAEGVVFKNLEAPYRAGRAQQHFKLKFHQSATARVVEVDPLRDRVSLEMLDGNLWRTVCGLKVPQGTVRRGEFVEVRYLSGTRDKKLVQPVFLRVREDASTEDCAFAQVKISKKWD